MEISMGSILESSPIKDIMCYHNISMDLFTGPNPSYHRHDAYEFYLFIRGKTKFYVEQHCYELTSGDCMIIKPGQLHRSIVTDTAPYERIGINITEDALRMLSSGSTDFYERFEKCTYEDQGDIVCISSYDMEQCIRLTDRYLQSCHSGKYGSDLMGMYYFTELLLFILQLFFAPKEKDYKNVMPELVSNTMTYVREHFAEGITLASVSSALNYSSNYVSLLFKRHTGLSLREYILDQKVECAKKLLAGGSSVSDACQTAGFYDYSNFIRTFKKRTGVPPGHYKKQNKLNF